MIWFFSVGDNLWNIFRHNLNQFLSYVYYFEWHWIQASTALSNFRRNVGKLVQCIVNFWFGELLNPFINRSKLVSCCDPVGKTFYEKSFIIGYSFLNVQNRSLFYFINLIMCKLLQIVCSDKLNSINFNLLCFCRTCADAVLHLPNPPGVFDPRLPKAQFWPKVCFLLPFPVEPSSENIAKMVRN